MFTHKFGAVRNDDNKINGGFTALDELYIPINADSTHWIFIKVATNANTIQLVDAQGKHDDNNRFLKADKNYMYNAYTKNVEGERQDFGAWR